jgi:DNA-binding GntR family transcriptional regulator
MAAHGHMAEQAYRWIKTRILSNAWPEGTQLREKELSELIGVSRTPVREALRRLTVEGVVETVPNHGSRTRSWTHADLDDIFSLRVLLEAHAATRAAQFITPAELHVLEGLCSDMESLVAQGMEGVESRRRLTELNEAFHAVIMVAARSERLESMARQLISLPLIFRTFGTYRLSDIERSMAHHRELLEALSAHNADWAQSVMRSHIMAGQMSIKRTLAGKG